MVKGSGTWTAEEDERLSKLVEVVGMKVRRCVLKAFVSAFGLCMPLGYVCHWVL